MFELINDAAVKLTDLLTDFVQRPIHYGVKISYSLICIGASIWLVAFTFNFMLKMLGL
jgi:hypothetical protein